MGLSVYSDEPIICDVQNDIGVFYVTILTK